MKVLCVIALFVAVAAAQSGDEEPETESTVEPSRPSWTQGRPFWGRPNRPPNRPPKGPPNRPPNRPPNGPRPGMIGILEFSPIFKINNVTFQNTTAIQLRDGDNLFIQLKLRMPQGIRSPCKQYLNLTYNSSNPNQLSLELNDFKQDSFLTVFKVQNVTFENTTSVLLSEGNNIFIRAKSGSKPGPRPHGPRHRPFRPFGPPFRPAILGNQYVRVSFKRTVPKTLSVEYGVVEPATINTMLEGLLEDSRN